MLPRLMEVDMHADEAVTIADVRGYALSSPIEPNQEREYHGGVRRLLKRDFVLVVVDTADGERGYAPAGASSSAMREFFEAETQNTFADLVEGPVADVLEGETVDVRGIHDRIAETGLPPHLEAEAASAIDVAFYDVLGKRTGAPIYELLAEEHDVDETPTTDLPLYASAGMYMPAEDYARQAATIDDLGFFGYKYRPALGPEGDRESVAAIREAVDDAEIMLDAHTWWKMGDHSYGFETIADIIADIAEHDVYWVEEPVEPDDYDGYRELADRTDVPLAGGESEEDPEGLVALADTGAVSFLQGDVRHHRGFTGCWRAVERCVGSDVEFVPHNFGTLLGLIANAHLVAAAPESDLLEYPVFEDDPALDVPADAEDPGMYPFELAFDVVEGGVDVSDGRLTVPDGPGLGIEVDEGVIEEYPHLEGPWTEFEYR